MFTEYIKPTYLSILSLALAMFACERDEVKPTEELKSLPVANAGPDFTINLPQERNFKLNGSGSYDPDGSWRPMAYTWTKISGPEIFNFSPNAAIAFVTVYESGKFVFELKVEDIQNNIARDTVTVDAVWGIGCDPNIVYEKASYIPASAWASIVPIDVSTGIGKDFLVMAGGRINQDDGWGSGDEFDSTVHVFNTANNTSFKSQLTVARAGVGIAFAGNDVFMAGGFFSGEVTDIVDILDLKTKARRKEKLSVARHSVTTVVADHLVFFAGGRDKNNMPLDIIDIYDLNSGNWRVAKLSIARTGIAAIALGTKVVFAGGDISYTSKSTQVDVYDLNTGQWTTGMLPTARSNISAAVLGNEIVLDPGSSDQFGNNSGLSHGADFLDPTTMRVRSGCILGRLAKTQAGQNLNTIVLGNKLYYLADEVICRYTIGDTKWAMSSPSTQHGLFALFSSGGQVFGLSGVPYNANPNVMEVKIVRVVF